MPGKFELLSNLAELAKAGYKPSDVKDILESLKTDPELKQDGGSGLKDKDPEEQKKEQEHDKDIDALADIIKRESEEN